MSTDEKYDSTLLPVLPEPAKTANHWPIGSKRGPYRATKFKRDVPSLLTDEEIKSLTGTARPGSHASRVTPEQMLQKAAQYALYHAYIQALDIMFNDQNSGHRMNAVKWIGDTAAGIKNKQKANLKGHHDVYASVTDVNISMVEPEYTPEMISGDSGTDETDC